MFLSRVWRKVVGSAALAAATLGITAQASAGTVDDIVNRGSSQEAALVRAAIPGLQIVRFQDDATAVQALVAQQVYAAAVPDSVAKDVMKKQADANLAIKFPFYHQPNAMAVRLDDNELRDWLNKAIAKMKGSGELNRISVKWTGNPLPDLPAQ